MSRKKDKCSCLNVTKNVWSKTNLLGDISGTAWCAVFSSKHEHKKGTLAENLTWWCKAQCVACLEQTKRVWHVIPLFLLIKELWSQIYRCQYWSILTRTPMTRNDRRKHSMVRAMWFILLGKQIETSRGSSVLLLSWSECYFSTSFQFWKTLALDTTFRLDQVKNTTAHSLLSKPECKM